MTLKEKILYHQIHPLKLVADIACEPVSLYFFWRHNLAAGLATHFIPPVLASLWLILSANLEAYETSSAGVYLLRYMSRRVEAVRFAGDVIMVLGAWFHRPSAIALGLAVIGLAWCGGLLKHAAA